MSYTGYACDISYYNPKVNDTYPYGWLIFRCCDGDFADPNCDSNATWCAVAQSAGKISGWTAYVVYRPGKNAAILNSVGDLPNGGHIMIDIESWGGAITGDHSAEINQLVAGLNRPGKVWAYGNLGDLNSIYPSRGTIPVLIAGYVATKPSAPNMLGWQYTNGVINFTNLPNSSPPFGPCDHNQLFITEATTQPPPPDDDEDEAMYTAFQCNGQIWLAAPGYWKLATTDEWSMAINSNQVRGAKSYIVTAARLNDAKSLALGGAQ